MAEWHLWLRRLLNEDVLFALGALSICAFLASAVVVPFVLARLPADYFVRATSGRRRHLLVVILKNFAGLLLVLLGVALLFLPGQGLLTIVLGLGLIDFPGRRALVLRVIARPAILKSINALRARMGRAPLEIPHRD